MPAAPAAPAAPTPPPSVGGLEGLSYNQLRTRRAELLDQRQSLANLRSTVAREYERASGTNKEGIGARLAVMDKSMVQIESDLSAVGLAMVPKRTTESPYLPPINPRPPNSAGREMLLVSIAVFLATMFIAVPAAVRRAKRRWLRESPSSGTSSIGVGKERLDRIEHAVDSIAVEIERVSENQRFMTRLMTETQLAGTIAAVRGSAELAKAAAEESPHA
jgi:hypothetical protein